MMARETIIASSPRTYTGFEDPITDHENDRKSQQSLELVIQAYSARWLPIVNTSRNHENTIARLWRDARKAMLAAINRPSYRSMLALYLFGLTPIPETISEEEELDGLSGPICVQSALQQVYMLRVRQKSLQFSGSKVSPTVVAKQFSFSPDPATTSSFLNAENIAHWAALIFDTSASLTLSSRPILSSGLFGFESERHWCLVKSCTEVFQSQSVEWQKSASEISESRANQIVASGSALKLLTWKISAVLREALRDGHDEEVVEKVFNAFLGSIETFALTYRELLDACQKRIHFLSQETKLRWYILMLHYNVGVLLVVDAVEATQRFDLLPRLSVARSEAESCIINTLSFGLETSYTIITRANGGIDGEEQSSGRVTVPLLAIDPYPHHTIACCQLMRRAIQQDLYTEKITPDTFTSLASILQRVLRLLPDSSKSVQTARKEVETLTMAV